MVNCTHVVNLNLTLLSSWFIFFVQNYFSSCCCILRRGERWQPHACRCIFTLYKILVWLWPFYDPLIYSPWDLCSCYAVSNTNIYSNFCLLMGRGWGCMHEISLSLCPSYGLFLPPPRLSLLFQLCIGDWGLSPAHFILFSLAWAKFHFMQVTLLQLALI